MRVGFISGRWAYVDGDTIWTDAGMGRLIDALSERATQVTLGLSVLRQRQPMHDHALSIPSDRLRPLPQMLSFRDGFFRHRACQAVIRRIEDECDVVVVQLPFTAPSALLSSSRPRVYHVCADVLAIVRAARHYRGPMRVASVTMATAVDRLYRHLLSRPGAAAVTNGRSLIKNYGLTDGQAIVSSSLRQRDIDSVPRARPQDAPFRVLFVGHLRPEKGIKVLLKAFEDLSRVVPDATLHIVGPKNVAQEGVADDVARRVERLGDRVQLEGNLPFGERLFQAFADADVLALPSLSEGTPRVLVEARAFRCPVVASDVGGIPTSVEHEQDGLLVRPGDAGELTEALVRLATDPALARRLSDAGLERVKGYTVEAMADAIIGQAEGVLR